MAPATGKLAPRGAARPWSADWPRFWPPWLRPSHGRGEAAGKAVAEVLRLVPYFDLGRARDWLVSQDEAFVSAYIEGLRLAGLPE